MKKTLLSLLAIFSISISLIAQNCTADPQFTVPGVYPDSATNLPTAYVGQPYAELITVVTPADTCIVVVFPPCTVVPIDSVVVTSVTGLPPGFTIVAENESVLPFRFLGGTSSCMFVTGNPTVQDTGNYPISVSGTSYATVFGLTQTQPFDVDYYFINVVDTTGGTTGVEHFSANVFDVRQNFPNPFHSSSTIEYFLPINAQIDLTVFNVLGEVILNKNINGTQGVNTYTLDASRFLNGVYFYQMTYQNEKIIKRFIVNK